MASFTSQVEASPWYPSIEAQMEQDGVPDWLWISIVRQEDPSLNPFQITYDPPGFSYGLFQFHNDSATGLSTTASGAKAASWLSAALAPLGTQYTPRQALTAAEQAGWPGNDPTLIAKEDPQRLAALQATMAEMGLSYAGTTGGSAGASASLSTPVTADQQMTQNLKTAGTDPFGIGAAVASLQTWGTGVAQNVFIGGVILAVIAGGFALIASNNAPKAGGGTIVPVPV